MTELQAVQLSFDEAKALTERIKDAVQNLWELLEEAKAKEVWRTLGCKNWKDYVTNKLGMSEQRSYQLLDKGKVIRGIEEAADSNVFESLPDVTQRQVNRLKPVLPQVKEHIQQAISSGTKPHDAVSNALHEFNALPSPKEATEIARDTDTLVIATDGVYHSGRNKGELAEVAARTHRIYRLYEALESLAQAQPVEAMIAEIYDFQRDRIDNHLDAAMEWLAKFRKEWPP